MQHRDDHCAERDTIARSRQFTAALERIVGKGSVITKPAATRTYRTGFRTGGGSVEAVVLPGTLRELWQVLKSCTAMNRIIIVQAANTGLTGGSTPSGDDYDRNVVIISMMRLARIHVIEQGRQVICLPGATLYELEKTLKPWGREPHSVIGSSCIGASVLGGICNNSGGALVRRGPAFTAMALYAQLDAARQLQLVNHLGVRLDGDPETMLDRLERGEFTTSDIDGTPERHGSDRDYTRRIRDVDADSPARFNADPARLFEASGCAGKVVVFAVRLDTFPCERETRVFYIGTGDPAELTSLRRHVLRNFEHLPITGEYMHRDMFDVAERYGKDAFLAIRYLGTARLPLLFKLKTFLDRLAQPFTSSGHQFSERLLQRISQWFPTHLPPRMREFRNRFDHHLMVRVAAPGIPEATNYLKSIFPSRSGDFFECTADEGSRAFLHRFVAAGAAMRYQAFHLEAFELIALDVALRQNDHDWFEQLPDDVRAHIHLALYYGHFFCHVFHQDYLVRPGSDAVTLKRRLCGLLDARQAEYPAEHNVGHLYKAKPALAAFYRDLDPCNCFNPGIGQTSKRANWE